MERTYYFKADRREGREGYYDIYKGPKVIDHAMTFEDVIGRYPDAIPVPWQVTYQEIAHRFDLWDAYCRHTMPLTKEQFDEGSPADRLTSMMYQGGTDKDVFKDNPRKLGLSTEQADWVWSVQHATKMDLHHAIELHEHMADLTAKHFALHIMAHDSSKSLTTGQSIAWEQIEKDMSEAVDGLDGITGMVFRRWDVAATSGIKFESGLTNVPTVGGIYKMHLDDDVVPNLLKEPFWVEYETRARNSTITATIKTLQATRDEWSRTAARSDNKLIGERNIIIDAHCRAFTQYSEHGKPMIKLELPNASLTGVSHMDAANAEKAKAFLESSVPDAAPFVVWDFETYAINEAATNNRLIDQLKHRLPMAVKPIPLTDLEQETRQSLEDAAAVEGPDYGQ
jgi:hypothetical protein